MATHTTDIEADQSYSQMRATAASARIPGDAVNQATANLPDAQRSAIRRFHSFYAENELSLEEAAKLLRLDRATLSLVFRGKYPAQLDNVVAEIVSFFELQDKRNQGRKLEFIETALTEKIWDVCHAAREFQKIAFIFGDMQIGKTEALQEYERRFNHGSTNYISMPTGGALSHFLLKLAEKQHISTSLRATEMRRRCIESFDDRMLLIVDEIHQCIPPGGKTYVPIQTVEFLRELYNEKKCGMVLCGTNVFRDAMEKGAVERILRQLKRRRLCTLQLPHVPCQRDLNTFAAAYGLPPSSGTARDLERQMVESEALGMWLTLLRMAAKNAAQHKQTMTWGHVNTARQVLRHLESGSAA